MRLPAVLGVLSGVLANSAPSPRQNPDSDPVRLRVMSYNIQAGRDAAKLLDLERTASAIEEQRPDIVVIQELDVHWSARSHHADQPQWLSRRLGMEVYFAPIYDFPPEREGGPNRQFGLGVMSRHPIRQTSNHSLTRLSTQVADAAPETYPGFPEVLIDVDGIPLWVYGCHLDYRPTPGVRTTQVTEMRTVIERQSGPKILAGDFSAEPKSSELAPLWNGPLKFTDTLAVVGRECQLTYPVDDPSRRFDYVLVSSHIDVTGAWVSDATASDHFPVVADLTIRRPT
jgi:endonuclease/exonuclease/phosphatase family metal-dependent hydrolase